MLKTIRRAANIFRVSGGWWGSSLVLDRAGIPVLGLWSEFVVSPEILAEQVGGILSAWGMPEHHKETAIGHLIYADLQESP